MDTTHPIIVALVSDKQVATELNIPVKLLRHSNAHLVIKDEDDEGYQDHKDNQDDQDDQDYKDNQGDQDDQDG